VQHHDTGRVGALGQRRGGPGRTGEGACAGRERTGGNAERMSVHRVQTAGGESSDHGRAAAAARHRPLASDLAGAVVVR